MFTKNSNTKQRCPLCKCEVPHSPRYPRYCCETCIQKAKNRDGLLVKFSNTSLLGGFQAVTEKSVSDDEYCTIDDVPCIAREAHFGGIVVQTMNENDASK